MYLHADLCLGRTQLQFLPNISLHNTYMYMHSLVLECALEISKCACRNAPLPMIGLKLQSKFQPISGIHALCVA